MADWRVTGMMYPGIIPIMKSPFAHPILVDMSELSLEPFAQPADTTNQGTLYHFKITGGGGTATKDHNETHLHRALVTVGWNSLRVFGQFSTPCDAWRDNNAISAQTPSIPFDFTIDGGSISDKNIADAFALSAPDPDPTLHAGEGTNGELVSNGTNFIEPNLGVWTFYGLSSTPAVIGTVVNAGVVTGYDAITLATTPLDVIATFSLSIRGNSSVLRYADTDWQYVSIFELILTIELSIDNPDGLALQGPDGSQNPDEQPSQTFALTTFSTNIGIGGLNSDTDGVGDCGQVDVDSTESMSESPHIFIVTTDGIEANNYTVPWTEAVHGAGTENVYAVPEGNCDAEITDPVYAVMPSPL